jgi:hypothetical protein
MSTNTLSQLGRLIVALVPDRQWFDQMPKTSRVSLRTSSGNVGPTQVNRWSVFASTHVKVSSRVRQWSIPPTNILIYQQNRYIVIHQQLRNCQPSLQVREWFFMILGTVNNLVLSRVVSMLLTWTHTFCSSGEPSCQLPWSFNTR